MSGLSETAGPFLQVAVICQAALREVDGSISLIRVVERIMVQGHTPEMQPFPIQNLTLVVLVKAGVANGKYKVTVAPYTPSGQPLPSLETAVLFEGGERGVGIITPMALAATEEGLYWFEVRVEEVVLTRIPLRVLYQRVPQIGIPQTPNG